MKLTTTLALSCMAAAAPALAQSQPYASYDAGNDMTYAISIPPTTSSTQSGDFYFQMSGPTSLQWMAMGIGGGMNGNSIFVMYEDGMGNVTVSPRLGVGYVMPQPNPQASVELLEGSGVMGDTMVANVRCMDCTTWDGRQSPMSFTGMQTFVHAHRTGSALDSTSQEERIQQHQINGQEFEIDMAAATSGSTGVNPFTAPVQPAGGEGSGEGSSSTEGSDTAMSTGGGSSMLVAHGVIMALTVVILLPLGAILMRVSPTPWWLHGGLQVLFLALFTAGWGIGYDIAGDYGIRFTGSGKTHTILGTVVFAFFWLQPPLGLVHHLLYKKKQKRTAVGHAHIWWGRIVFILAIVNGGLGLKLAANSRAGEIAYGVVAGGVGVIYVAAAVFGEMKRKKQSKHAGEKAMENGT